MFRWFRRYRREGTFGLAVGVTAVVCLHTLFAHAFRPSETGDSPRQWPARSALKREAGRGHVVLFAHPGCPCTLATLTNLAELSERLPDRFEVSIVFVTCGLNQDFVARAPVVKAAEQMRTARVWDDDGREAHAFGARVSGEVFAFNEFGEAVFHGGVTAARGHVGGSDGLRQLERTLMDSSRGVIEAPVFGCRLPQTNSLVRE
jgi:hypothetical protein